MFSEVPKLPPLEKRQLVVECPWQEARRMSETKSCRSEWRKAVASHLRKLCIREMTSEQHYVAPRTLAALRAALGGRNTTAP
jgi:hypothetical protein